MYEGWMVECEAESQNSVRPGAQFHILSPRIIKESQSTPLFYLYLH
jgi:hypothetical protein